MPCGITKQGSKNLRTILVEIAQVVAKMKNNRLSKFFHRLRGRKNYNVAITALARKLISIIYHHWRRFFMGEELEAARAATTARPVPSRAKTGKRAESRKKRQLRPWY